jgi:transposase-like protein
MMAECGIIVDHSTLHRWVIRLMPLLDKAFIPLTNLGAHLPVLCGL